MKRLNIHCFIHDYWVHNNKLEIHVFTEWCKLRGHKLTFSFTQEGEKLPSIKNIDWIIVLGCYSTLIDYDREYWIKTEYDFVCNTINNHKIVMGICFGAQMIANIMGARVYKNTEKEFGWHKLFVTEEAKNNNIFNFLPQQLDVVLLHNDTFDLPSNAIRIGSTEACLNQGFIVDTKIVALQFHLEQLSDNIGTEDMPGNETGKYIQSLEYIKSQYEKFNSSNILMYKLLDNLEFYNT